MIKLDRPRIYIDMNEMVTEEIALLSKEDVKTDSDGNRVAFYDGMPVFIYSDDASDTGETDNLLADGIAVKYDLKGYPGWEHVKWCVRIDWKSLIHESDLQFLQQLTVEIKEHPHDLQIFHETLRRFKEQGMSKDRMQQNLEKLRQESDPATEDILRDLMDYVSGWCNPSLAVYD